MQKILILFIIILSNVGLFAQNQSTFTQEEVIYGRKSGIALTLNVLTPKNPNGKAVINLVSGNWMSSYNASQGEYLKMALRFIEHGYTVFLVIHSSGPKFTISDALSDVLRSIQFVRYNAKKYSIDPEYIAIWGHSSGGHLSLLAATSNDTKNATSKDSISRVSSKVQAVIAFCPPTDFLNWGSPGITIRNAMKPYFQKSGIWGAFNFTKLDSLSKVYVPIDNLNELVRLDSLLSPTNIVSKDDPPAYLIHGDVDKTVPIQQSISFSNNYKKAELEVVLIIKEGQDHYLNGVTKEDYALNGVTKEDYANMFLWLDNKLNVKK